MAPAVLFLLGAAAAVWALRSPDPRGQFRAALIALERADLDSVAKIARSLEKRRGFNPHSRLLRGAVLLRSGDQEYALRLFSQLSPDGELREPAMVLATECLYHLGRLGEAEVLARKLAIEQPDNANAHRWLAAIYYDLGANTLAVGELKRVSELDAHDFGSHRLLGIMHLDFEDYFKAERHLREALNRSPPEIRREIVENLAKALVSQLSYDAALQVAARRRTNRPRARLSAECLWSLDRKDEVYSLLAEARRQAPDSRAVLLLDTRMHQSDGRPEQAIAPLSQVLEIDRHDAEARYQLAQAYRQLGHHEFDDTMARWKESKELLERMRIR